METNNHQFSDSSIKDSRNLVLMINNFHEWDWTICRFIDFYWLLSAVNLHVMAIDFAPFLESTAERETEVENLFIRIYPRWEVEDREPHAKSIGHETCTRFFQHTNEKFVMVKVEIVETIWWALKSKLFLHPGSTSRIRCLLSFSLFNMGYLIIDAWKTWNSIYAANLDVKSGCFWITIAKFAFVPMLMFYFEKINL